MSREELKKYIPDTPEELAKIGSAITRLGSAMSGVLLFSANTYWVLASLVITWIGAEINIYFKTGNGDKKE